MKAQFDKATPADIRTPLAAANFSSDGLLMQELSLAGKILLRGDFSNADVQQAVEQVLALPVEIEANTFSRDGEHSVYWLGPDERLLYTCLLYTSPSPRDRTRSRMPSSA